MRFRESAWNLPSAQAFLNECADFVGEGGAIVSVDATAPQELPGAFGSRLRGAHDSRVVRQVSIVAGAKPAAMVAEAFGGDAEDVASLACTSIYADHVAIVDLRSKVDAELEWIGFFRRMLVAGRPHGHYVALFLILHASHLVPSDLPVIRWANRLQRLDLAIWADFHSPTRREPFESLAESLAVELGGWRLELVAAIAESTTDDLLAPIEFLRNWSGSIQHFACDPARECGAQLLRRGDLSELSVRIWRAQLRALFPWIEELRQVVLQRHRARLVVEPEQRRLGVSSVDDLELGSIAYQLRNKVPPPEADMLFALARVRNDLAHRRPAVRNDIQMALDSLGRLGYDTESPQ